MPEINGTIRLDNGEKLAAVLTVDSKRLVVAAGDHEIGNWAVSELAVKRRNSEFRIGVEGEELVIDAADPVALSQELALEARKPKQSKTRKTRVRREKRTKAQKAVAPPVEVTAPPVAVEPLPVSAPELEPEPEPEIEIPASPMPVAETVPEPVVEITRDRVAVAAPVAESEKDQPSGPSRWQQIPTKWKLAGVGGLLLVVLGIFVPNLLALLLFVAGMGILFLAVAAKSDSGTVIMPPAIFGTDLAIFGGIGMVLLAAVIMVIS